MVDDPVKQAYGFIRGSVSRFGPEGQHKAMEAHSIPWSVQEGGKTLTGAPNVTRDTREAFLRMAKPGRLLAVHHLFLLVDPSAKAKGGGKRKDLWNVVRRIEENGGVIWELATGRRSDSREQRDGMIEDAIDALARGRPKYSNRDRRGRPPKEFPDDVWEKAKAVWESRRHKTWQEAAKRLPKGMTAKDAWSRFGPRE
jgi:hypothetical protein